MFTSPKEEKGQTLSRLAFEFFFRGLFVIILFVAPKPIARHLVLAAQPVKPTPKTNNSTESFKNPQRPSYPKELLKHRFMPYGSLAKTSADENLPIDIDAISGAPTDDAVPQPLVPSSSRQQKEKEKRLESSEIVEVRPKQNKKRKAVYVEITETLATKKRKKTNLVS